MRTYFAFCFQAPNGRYLSLEENRKSEVQLEALSVEGAFEQLEEMQLTDSEIPVKERWNVYEG